MADIRSLSGASVPTPARPLPAARAEAIKAAQRAFFDQALSAAAPSTPARPAEPVPPVAAATRRSFDASAPAPRAPLRPGSLLDIKV